MSDTKENRNNMRNREILLAWFAAASAAYLDLGLTPEQRMCLCTECVKIADKHNVFEIHFVCADVYLQIKHTMGIFMASEEEKCEEKFSDMMTECLISAFSHLAKEEYDDAISNSKNLLHIAQASGDKESEMTAHKMLGKAHLEKEEYDDAISYSEKCLAIAQESGDKVAEKTAYIMLGEAHLKKKEYDDTISYGQKCLAIAQETGDKMVEINAYMKLGKAHFIKEDYHNAILYSKKCLAIAKTAGDKAGEIDAYMRLANAHLKKKEKEDAILYSEKLLAIAKESGDEGVEIIAYMTLGRAHLLKNEYQLAMEYSEKCLAIAEKPGGNYKVAKMNAYNVSGIAHFMKEEYDEAILYSEKCLTIAQEFGEEVFEMNAYLTIGNSHLEKRKYDEAVLYSKKSFIIAQKSGDQVAEMKAYMVIAEAHLKKEEYDDAILYSKKRLAIAKETGNKVNEMTAYLNMGDAHLMKVEYNDAILYSEKCLAIAQESGDKMGEISACLRLGEAHLKKKEYDDAILYSKKCLAQECCDKTTKMNAYMMLGDAHFDKEEYDDAILYSTKYLAIAQESGDKVAEMNAYSTLANAHFVKEEYDSSHSYIVEGMKMARELRNKDNIKMFNLLLYSIYVVIGIIDIQKYSPSLLSCENQEDSQSGPHFLGDFFRQSSHFEANQQYEEAISCLEEAEVVATATRENRNFQFSALWACKQKISEMYVLLGQCDKGIKYQQEAIDVTRSKLQQAISHFSLGKIYYKLEQIEDAEKSLKQSLKCYEVIFDGLKQNDPFKIEFLSQYEHVFKMLLKVLAETNKNEEALILSDRYRAKALKDILFLSYGMKKEETEKDLQYANVQSLVSSSKFTLVLYATCDEKLCTFLLEAGNELEFSVQHFEYCEKHIDKLIDQAFDDIKVRQEVNCADGSLDVIDNYEENKNLKADELSQLLTRQKKKRLSEQCRSICGCRGNPSENSDVSSLTGLEILYHKLIENIKCLIKQDEIVIIPEGPLCKVPFAALRDPDTGQYLSELKRIRMAPSIATLKLLQEYSEGHHSSKEALIIGGPITSGPVMLDGVETEFETEFEKLDGAIEEADEIAQLLGVAKPLLGGMATKPEVIKRLREGASVVHIAAHGSLEKATIVLAPSPEIKAKKIPDEEDYMLTTADVQQAQVRAQLVVLSCCYSGRGQIKAEGVVGMCRAFLASGARAVVGSLWAVDDDATWMFMETFYKYLKDGKSASKSLHQTMNDMRRTPEYSDPKYWAPFFLMGDDVTIKFED